MIWNGSQWVDYVLNSSEMSGGIGSVYVKCGPTYATIYCPNGTSQREVAIERESWMAEWYDEYSNEWICDEVSHGEVSYSVNSSGICFIRKSILKSGATLKVSYVLRKGSNLKYLIDLNAATARKYQIVWKLAGINCTTARLASETINVTSTSIIGDLPQERLTTSWVHFLDGLSNIRASISWFDTFWFNETAGQYETCFQRLELSPDSLQRLIQAKVLFGNFTLSEGETAYLDPTLKTLDLESPASVDGSITKSGDEYPPTQQTIVWTDMDYLWVGQSATPNSYHKYRSYVYFPTNMVPTLAYNMSSKLKLKTYDFCCQSQNFTLKVIGGEQPIYGRDLDANDWDKGNLTVATWNTTNYPGDDIFINLTVTPEQINKFGPAQFRLVSNRDEQNIQPQSSEYISFYAGDSWENEPRLEVTYYVNIVEI